MNDFLNLKIAETYTINGQKTTEFSNEGVTPNYLSFDGWNQSLAGIDTFEKLPKNVQKYLDFVVKNTNTKISIISTGPNRLETFFN